MRLGLGALLACAEALVAVYPVLQNGPRYLHTAPAWSLSGMFNLCILPLATGGCVLTGTSPSTIHPGKMLHDAARLKADILWLAPSVLRAVLADAPPSNEAPRPRLRALLTGMSPISAGEKAKAEEKLGAPVFENYGLAETLLVAASQSTRGGGLPLTGVRLSITDGEIRARSPFMADGYLTSDGLLPLNLDDEGAVRTGDFGSFDAAGELMITGRMKAIVKRDGPPVLLPAVEAAARRAPGVVEAVAVPVAHAHGAERYVLFLSAAAGADRGSLVEAVQLTLAKLIDRHAWPDEIVALDRLPQLPNGKVDASELRRMSENSPMGRF